jgi:hypothetical protein
MVINGTEKKTTTVMPGSAGYLSIAHGENHYGQTI